MRQVDPRAMLSIMRRESIIATTISVVVVGGLFALAVPVVTSVWSAAAPIVQRAGSVLDSATAVPTAEPTAASIAADDPPAGIPDGYVALGDGIWRPAGGPGACTTSAFINITSSGTEPAHGKLLGELVEMGPSDLASGTALRDDAGEIYAYEVAPGDTLIAVGERFCIDFSTVGGFNHATGSTIHPGETLYLRPDPQIPWVSPYAPYNAEAGSSTIPYFDAFVAFTNAVSASDIGTARSVWDRLGPDIDPGAAAVVTRALAESDWTVLRQMFP